MANEAWELHRELNATEAACVAKCEERGLRFMDASRGGPCDYCGEHISIGKLIGGDYGVKWGHVHCVISAHDSKELILSPNNKDRLKSKMLHMANRVWSGGRVFYLVSKDLPEWVRKAGWAKTEWPIRGRVAHAVYADEAPRNAVGQMLNRKVKDMAAMYGKPVDEVRRAMLAQVQELHAEADKRERLDMYGGARQGGKTASMLERLQNQKLEPEKMVMSKECWSDILRAGEVARDDVLGRYAEADARATAMVAADYAVYEKRVLALISDLNLELLYDEDERPRVLEDLMKHYAPEPMPIHRCGEFAPLLVGPMWMPPEQRPNPEMQKRGEKILRPLEDEWGKIIDDRLKLFKLRSRLNPRCPVHSGRWALKDGSQVQVGLELQVTTVADYLKWAWLVCPGHPDEWDGKAGVVH